MFVLTGTTEFFNIVTLLPIVMLDSYCYLSSLYYGFPRPGGGPAPSGGPALGGAPEPSGGPASGGGPAPGGMGPELSTAILTLTCKE